MKRRSPSASVESTGPASDETPKAAHISLLPPPASEVSRAAVAPDAVDASSAFAAWKPEALGLKAGEVLRCTGDVHLACRNLIATCEAIQTARAQVDESGLAVDWARVERARSLGLALLFAQARIERVAPTVRAQQAKLTAARELLVHDARAQVAKNRFPAETVRDLFKDPSEIARTQAVLTLVELYRARWTDLVGRTAVEAADLRDAEALASDLLPRLGAGKSVRRPRVVEDVALRDRFWTLAVRHHEMLARIAGVVWGRDVASHIPGIHSRRVVRRAKSPAPPTPVTP